MKSKDELNAIKEEVETVSRKLSELSEDELKQVSGGWNWQEFEVHYSPYEEKRETE